MYVSLYLLAIFAAAVHADTYRFEVNGGFSAGDAEDDGSGGQRRPFSIEPAELEDVQVFEEADLNKAFDPTGASVSGGKVTFSETKTTRAAGARPSNQQGQQQGFQFKHMKPRDTSAEGSTMYLPHIDNTYVHETEGNSVRPIRLEGWILKTIVTPLKKEIKQSQNAIRVLGALLGLNMKDLREVLTFDRETVAFIESVKSGAVPIYVPGDVFVGETLEVNTNDAPNMPSFCDAWSGANDATATNDAKGTTDWILENVMGFDLQGGARGELKIVQVDSTVTDLSGDNKKYQRWDNKQAFEENKGTRDASGDIYKIDDAAYENKFRDQDNLDIGGQHYNFAKIFNDGATGVSDHDKAARYDETVMHEFEKEVDACKGP